MKVQKILIGSVLLLIISLVMLTSVAFAVQTFVVEETEEVSLDVTAKDPDQDSINYIYSQPLDNDGGWVTNYDDAGEYLVDITATDGTNNATETIKIVVVNKNRAPVVIKNSITFQETDSIDLTKFVIDPDEDILQYQFSSPFDKNGVWDTGYSDAGRYAIDFVINDGDFYQKERIEIIIEETNQAPGLNTLFSKKGRVHSNEGEVFEFSASALDNDRDTITYSWYLDNSFIGNEMSGEYYFNYDSSDEHILKLVVSDGELETLREWIVDVVDTNRKPTVNDLLFSIYESEKVELNLPKTDLDGDELTYSLEPLFENNEWETTFYDAGNYTFEGVANDGEFQTTFKIKVEVLELDQAPTINIPQLVEVHEGEDFIWNLNIEDPDNDDITVEINGMPSDAMYFSEEGIVSWTVPYSFIQRRDSLITNTLNMLGIEQLFLAKKDIPVEITACGSLICSKEKTVLRVHNTNRAPYFVEVHDQYAFETDTVKPYVKAIDPDGDIIRYSFGGKFGIGGSWKTDYSDAGEYVIPITASDWSLSANKELLVVVEDKNRVPEFKIIDDKITVFEGEQVVVDFKSSDLDEDFLLLTVNDGPINSNLNGSFTWNTGYNVVNNSTKETVTLSFTLSDGIDSITKTADVTIKSKNQLPVVRESYPEEEIYIITDEAVTFMIDVVELDILDELTYTWEFSGLDFNKVQDTNTILRTFKSPGKKNVKVTISDGTDSIEKEWTIFVSKKANEVEVALEAPVVEEQKPTAPVDDTYLVYTITNW